MPRRFRTAFLLLPGLALLLLTSCGIVGGDDTNKPQRTPIPEPGRIDDFVVGKPLNRGGIGDVELVFDRYASTRATLIAQYESQDWFTDGLSREESLFVERGLSFVAKYDGPRSATIGEETIRRKLFLYDKLTLSRGEVELLLIYEPGQNAEREMTLIKQILPALEALVGVPYPEKVMTFVNGDFDINDFNEGEFIRIDRCCVINSFILAHELAHTYWSVAASWFNEGMADLYAVMSLEWLNREMPPGWRREAIDLDSYVASRRQQAARYPAKILPQRLTEEGVYQAADAFLYDIRGIVGAEDFAAAARRIYLTSDYGRTNVSDFRVEEVILGFAEGDQTDRVKDLFNQMIWGDDGQRYESFKERETTP